MSFICYLKVTIFHVPTYHGKTFMILFGMRCPKDATTPKSQKPCTGNSFGRGQMEIGRLCSMAYFATTHGWGFGAGTTTDSSLTTLPFFLKIKNTREGQ